MEPPCVKIRLRKGCRVSIELKCWHCGILIHKLFTTFSCRKDEGCPATKLSKSDVLAINRWWRITKLEITKGECNAFIEFYEKELENAMKMADNEAIETAKKMIRWIQEIKKNAV